MYELIQITENCYYVNSPVKVGVVKVGADEVVLIDSGNDKDAGKKIKRILDANGWTLRATYNTHSHADHTGGNKYLQTNTGCRIYAPGIECDFTKHPILEPSFLYGGYPPKALRHKFLMAKESDAEPLTEEVLPDGFEIIPLPGHFFDMVGFRTPDGVYYIADCLSSKETLEKYQIHFLVDPGAYIETLEHIKEIAASLDTDDKVFVPCHADIATAEEITELADINIKKVHEVADAIAELLTEPLSFDELLKKIFDRYDLTMDLEQHALVGSTVRSYLTWLEDEGRIHTFIENNMVFFMAGPTLG